MKRIETSLKTVETFTRHNKRIKEVNIYEMRSKIREILETIGALLYRDSKNFPCEEKYYLPENWFVTLEFEEHDKHPIHQRVTLVIEHFGEKISYPWREGQLRSSIKEHKLRRIKNK